MGWLQMQADGLTHLEKHTNNSRLHQAKLSHSLSPSHTHKHAHGHTYTNTPLSSWVQLLQTPTKNFSDQIITTSTCSYHSTLALWAWRWGPMDHVQYYSHCKKWFLSKPHAPHCFYSVAVHWYFMFGTYFSLHPVLFWCHDYYAELGIKILFIEKVYTYCMQWNKMNISISWYRLCLINPQITFLISEHTPMFFVLI